MKIIEVRLKTLAKREQKFNLVINTKKSETIIIDNKTNTAKDILKSDKKSFGKDSRRPSAQDMKLGTFLESVNCKTLNDTLKEPLSTRTLHKSSSHKSEEYNKLLRMREITNQDLKKIKDKKISDAKNKTPIIEKRELIKHCNSTEVKSPFAMAHLKNIESEKKKENPPLTRKTSINYDGRVYSIYNTSVMQG